MCVGKKWYIFNSLITFAIALSVDHTKRAPRLYIVELIRKCNDRLLGIYIYDITEKINNV